MCEKHGFPSEGVPQYLANIVRIAPFVFDNTLRDDVYIYYTIYIIGDESCLSG